ncbi:MAG: type IV secretion system DNA-binding domain-containing protein [Candidatus Niyogibacteria bacterium]|nr:type IV secretion system DNA-binding domain-containing protein [Candidatus Niyogibacteria bacterium]
MLAREGRVQIIKLAPPPPELPIYKQADPRDIVFFGRTNYVAALEEKRFIFGIKRRDRRRHMYVVGKSGVGKSKLLELMIRQDIGRGHGVCVIDPHGDLIEEILKFIPEERVEDTVVIDPSDTAWPVSFNPLRNVHQELKHQVAQGLIEVMARQFGANWSARLEHVLRFTLLALLDFPFSTMRGMISMLTDRKYRQKVIEYIEDEMVRRFWAIEFADWSEKFDTEAIIPLVNKLGQFLSNPYLRHIFGQRENKVDLERIMNEKKILLISLSKGKLGEENSSFFGSMFITKLKQAGMARAAMPEEAREDFYLYVDEFHNLVTTTFESLFSESRKYGLALVVAHQYMAQLLAQVRATVLGNVGTIIVFRVGGDDAAHLEAEMTPVVKAKDMVNLGMQQFYIKMTIDGDTSDPFSAETLKILPPEHESFKDRILEYNHATYALTQEEAKKRIADEEAELLGLAPESAAPEAEMPASESGGSEHPEPLL